MNLYRNFRFTQVGFSRQRSFSRIARFKKLLPDKQILLRPFHFLRNKHLAQLALPISHHNKTLVYFDGSDAFVEMWDAIRKARTRVWVETYILDPG